MKIELAIILCAAAWQLCSEFRVGTPVKVIDVLFSRPGKFSLSHFIDVMITKEDKYLVSVSA